MAIEQINEDTFDYAMFLDTLIESYKGKQTLTISNYNNDSAPQVTNGSVFENTGALFRNTALVTPTGYAGISNSTTFYLYLDVEPTPTFIFSSVTPAWSDAKQGWYNGNDRAFFSMFKDSGGTLYQVKNKLEQASNILTKVIPIGGWDMTGAAIAVTHGIDNYYNIRSVNVMIRRDNPDAGGVFFLPLDYLALYIAASAFIPQGGVQKIEATTITLFILGSGGFDNTNFNDDTFNRGWVTIQYVE